MSCVEAKSIPKRIIISGLAAIILAMTFAMTIMPGEAKAMTASEYWQKTDSFLADSRWSNGISWGARSPKLSSWSSTGCCAYAADFAQYVYGAGSPSSGTAFYNASEIRSGDIVYVNDSKGEHWFVVVERNNSAIRTAEGNVSGLGDWFGDGNSSARVVVTHEHYELIGNTIYDRLGGGTRTLSVGYHYDTGGATTYGEGGSVGNDPEGSLDTVEGAAGYVFVGGWAFDRDDLNSNLAIHVYFGGPAGDSNAECYGLSVAGFERSDVNSTLGVPGDHGFNNWIKTSKRGSVPVYVYAIGVGGGNPFTCLGTKTVTVNNPPADLPDNFRATISSKVSNRLLIKKRVDINLENIEIGGTNNTAANEEWNFKRLDSGGYVVQCCESSGKYIGVDSFTHQVNVKATVANNQLSLLPIPMNSGGYMLVPLNAKAPIPSKAFCLEAASSSAAEGVNIQLTRLYGTNWRNTQIFNINQLTDAIPTGISTITCGNDTIQKGSTYELESGQSVQLHAAITPSNVPSAKAGIVWESSNSKIATIDESGKLTAVAAGTAQVTAYCAYDTTNISAKYYFKVNVVDPTPQNIPVSTITINPSSYTLNVGETRSPLTLIGPTNATDTSIVWSSSNSSVATVSKGTITAVAPGTATITATAHDGSGVSATCTIEVVSAAVQKEDQVISGTASYAKTEGDAAFALDATVTKGDGALSYASSDSAVALVDANGNVTVGQAGTAVITVTAAATDAFNEASMDVVVTVQAKAEPPAGEVKVSAILLDSEELEVEVGQSESLSATVIPTNATNKNVTWVSSNKQVASVNASGVVHAAKAGTTTVKAVALDGSGVTASCAVTVKEPAGTDPQPQEPTVIKATPQITLAKTTFTYNGGLCRPKPTVKVDGKVLPTSNYTYSFDQGCSTVGTYRVYVKLKDGYEGSGSATYKIVKAANPLSASGKTAKVKLSKLKKKAQTVKKAKAFSVSGAQGPVTFKKVKGNSKIAVSSAGKVTVKKGLKKGTYKVTVNVTAGGNRNYKPATKAVILKVKVASGA